MTIPPISVDIRNFDRRLLAIPVHWEPPSHRPGPAQAGSLITGMSGSLAWHSRSRDHVAEPALLAGSNQQNRNEAISSNDTRRSERWAAPRWEQEMPLLIALHAPLPW